MPVTRSQCISANRSGCGLTGAGVCIFEALWPQSVSGRAAEEETTSDACTQILLPKGRTGIQITSSLSLSLLGSVRLHLQLLHIQLRLKHSLKLPQPLPKEPKWEIPFLGMFCHLVPSWEISSVCALGKQKHQELLSLGEHKCFRRTKRCRSLDLGALEGQTHG